MKKGCGTVLRKICAREKLLASPPQPFVNVKDKTKIIFKF